MKKKKKVDTSAGNSEWKPVVSSLFGAQAEDIQKRRGKKAGNAATAGSAVPTLFNGRPNVAPMISSVLRDRLG